MQHLIVFLCAVTLGMTACSTADPNRAVRVDAFDAAGNSDTRPDADMARRAAEAGVVIAFEPGDPIVLEFDVIDSDLVEKVDEHTLRVKRPFNLYASPGGLRISLEGEDFDHDVTDGSFSVGVSVRQQRNVVSLSLRERINP